MTFLRLTVLLFFSCLSYANDGYDLWLRYDRISDRTLLEEYQGLFGNVAIMGSSATIEAAKSEMHRGLFGLLGTGLGPGAASPFNAGVLIGKTDMLPESAIKQLAGTLDGLGANGYLIKFITSGGQRQLVLTAADDIGILYGVFGLLRQLQMHKPPDGLEVATSPKVQIRMLNHWDNLDRTVERGYAGFSIWNWHTLPDFLDPRYTDYARANASIGINGVSLTNVNANAEILTAHYLEKVKALAGIFRPYGIRVYLTARFSAPMEIGGLQTADPLDASVRQWWKEKAAAIYALIPDFGGFLVKANSEGQPGPQNYGRTHADGANMLAEAVAPFHGIVMWRAFVYSEHDSTDRAKQAYSEFVPYDGEFRENVLIQVKNGPIDFQPREPFHPMFGAMPHTPVMMEFQITQEYLGFSTHLVYLPRLFEEVLESDTYRKGKGSTVAKVVEGTLFNNKLSGMAGVANIGNDINWTGHPFGQANWYGFGRLAWDPEMDSGIIAEEWLRATFSNEPGFIEPMKALLFKSREAVVHYMNPLGLHHIFDTDHHYGPGPWVGNLSRPEWNPVYYHQAGSDGIGFNRTATGSNALEQYAPEVAARFRDPVSCPEDYLLWFHHLPWDFHLKDGSMLWDGIARTYQLGVDEVTQMQKTWSGMEPYVDAERFSKVTMLLKIQLKEAQWWRDACLLYFQQFSGMPLPAGVDAPAHDLDYYMGLKFPFAPGIRPSWD